MVKYLLRFLIALVIVFLLAYFLGPKPHFNNVDNDPLNIRYPIVTLENIIKLKEAKTKGIKADNESQFYWIDSLQKTEYSLVYLHGFSASHGEAFPILQNLAERYGMNAYFPRLYMHGLKDIDAFTRLTPEGLVNSARDAVAIGKSIGEKLIIMSTSTGSTLATYLASADPEITALICTAPNFDLYDPKSQLIVGPWGKQLFRKMMGGNYRQWEANSDIHKYWTCKNHIDGHIALRNLLNQTMTEETFSAINQPLYIAYYYQDENNCDKIISIDAIEKCVDMISTPKNKIWIRAFDNARGHVISSQYMNPNWQDVQSSIFNYCDSILQLQTRKDTIPGRKPMLSSTYQD